MEGSIFPFDEYGGTWVDFGTVSKLLRDAVYCKGSTTVLEST